MTANDPKLPFGLIVSCLTFVANALAESADVETLVRGVELSIRISEAPSLARLTRELPNAVDQLTPHGRLPTEAEASRLS